MWRSLNLHEGTLPVTADINLASCNVSFDKVSWKEMKKTVTDMIITVQWDTAEFLFKVSNHSCYSHRLCIHIHVMYFSWVHVFLTQPRIPYGGMMDGNWQQSLTLYAQLLFAPAVNPQVQCRKQKSECVWGAWVWHKVKDVVDLICGFIQIVQIENPFVTEYFKEIMFAATNVQTQLQYMGQKLRDEQVFPVQEI